MKRREFIRFVGGAARAAWRHTGRLPPGVSADALFSGQMRRETNISMESPPIIPTKRSIPGQILSGGPQPWTKVRGQDKPSLGADIAQPALAALQIGANPDRRGEGQDPRHKFRQR